MEQSRRRSNEDLVRASRSDPRVNRLVPAAETNGSNQYLKRKAKNPLLNSLAERLALELKLDLLLLSRLKEHLLEALKLTFGRSDPTLNRRSDVNLSNLGSSDLSRVLDLERDGELAFGRNGRDGQRGEVKSGVTSSVSKREERSERDLVVVTVVDVDSLAVDDLSGSDGGDTKVGEGGVVLETNGERERKLSTGVDLAEQNIGDSVAAFISSKEGVDESGSI